jgi:hypothetical protein
MGIGPQTPAERHELFPGVIALTRGLLWLEGSRTLVAADAHLAYEDVIGGALPLWSTAESLDLLTLAIARTGARELVLLGDVIHAARLSEGAARVVGEALDALRAHATLTLVAGNHEGRSRGRAVLGDTVESVERDGWLLVHGDEGIDATADAAGCRRIVGHLHPSLPLARGESVPAFLSAPVLIVVPALTPYSRGLNILGEDCAKAIRDLGASVRDTNVVASTADRVYPFGRLFSLRQALRARPAGTNRRL